MRKFASAVGLSLFTTHSVAVTIKIENETSLEINKVYLAPAIDGDWGEDRLGDSILEPGNHLTLTDIAPGRWKLRLINADEDECVLKDQKIVLSTSFDIRDDEFFYCKQMNQ